MTTYSVTYNARLVAQTSGNCDPNYGAQNYDSACGYNGTLTSTNTGTGVTQPQSPIDALANTGYDILVPAAVAVSIVGASVIMFVKQMLRTRNSQ